MDLIISFSGRENGNCDLISRYIASETDRVVYFRELDVHDCSGCKYECFDSRCKYREDDIYRLYESMSDYGKVFFVVPMYCGNPPSMYFKFNERSQDFFMQHGDCWEAIVSRLYIIGLYGSRETDPDFIPGLAKWFAPSLRPDHVLGIERHRYGQKIGDSILDVDEVRSMIDCFAKK